MSPTSLVRWPLLLWLRHQARSSLKHHRPLIIGVAGAVGKSSTVQAIFAALQGSRRVRFTPGNSETGVPLGILNIKQPGYTVGGWISVFFKSLFPSPELKDLEVLIVEMGTDELTAPKNMEYLLTIVKPDVSVWLNVYATHLSQFGKGLTREEQNLPEEEKAALIVKKIAAEDGKIITESGCRIGIVCADNAPLVAELERHEEELKEKLIVRFGTAIANDVVYERHAISLSGTSFVYRIDNQEIIITLPGFVVPVEYREVFAAALVAARAAGVPIATAAKNIMNNFVLPPGRSSLLFGINGSTIIDSSYNASPEAMVSFLTLFKTLAEAMQPPRVILLGDMRELGEHAAREHASLADRLPGAFDYVYCVGELSKRYVVEHLAAAGKSTMFKDIRWFEDARELGAFLKVHLPEHALVLVKGSQNTIFLEEAVAAILRDPLDRAKLCRQETYWKKMKEEFFRKIS